MTYHGARPSSGRLTYNYGHYPYHGGYWRPYYRNYGWGWYPWTVWSGWWWGGPWWGWGWGWWPTVTVGIEAGADAGAYAGADARAYAPRGAWGVVKTDVEPKEAEVWLDGTYVGTSDDFGGYPDFLYLKPGSYKVELRLENYQPLAADLSIASGELVTLDRKLEIEPGKNALDFFPPTSKGVPHGRYFAPGGKPASARVAIDDDTPIGIDDQGDRMPRQRSQSAVVRSNRARLRFSVTPEDAAIYVDDKYVGVGEELNNSQRGMLVDAGTRSVTISRPGFKTKTVEVTAKVGQPVDIVVDLEKQ